MSRMRKVAMVAYAVAVGSLVLGATVYLTRSEFLVYHAQALGMAWEAVPVNIRFEEASCGPTGPFPQCCSSGRRQGCKRVPTSPRRPERIHPGRCLSPW